MSHPTGSRVLSQIRAAADLWEGIRGVTQPADRWLGNYFHQHRSRFGSRDRRFLSETTYALFRRRTFLELWAKEMRDESPVVLVALAAFSENLITAEQFEAAAGFLVPELFAARELPPSFRSSGELETLAARCSFPLWLAEKWQRQFGMEQAAALIETSQKRPSFTVRANPIRISRDSLLGLFRKKGFDADPAPRAPWGIIFRSRQNLFDSEEFREGYFEIQDEGSQMVTALVAPEPGQVVWDVCAGGGGKSLLLATIMENKGRVIATDIRAWKLDELRKRAKRAGLTNIFPADLERVGEIQAARRGMDRILVDAPCSGTGTLRRNPDAKWKLRPEVFAAHAADQLAILRRAAPFLKTGGRLCYVTCSLEPEENEAVIEAFLAAEPVFQMLRLPDLPEGRLRLSPAKDGTDGFFLAILEKKN